MKAYASVLSDQPGHAAQRVPRKVFPMAVWEKYGLLAPRFIGARAEEPRIALLPRETRFRMALEEKGGLFALFGQYLAGRADLLPSPHLRQLGTIRSRKGAESRALLDRDLGGRVSGIEFLRPEPRWDVYQGIFQGRRVTIEAYEPRDGVDEALEELRRGLRAFRDTVESNIVRPAVLEHFREWLGLQDDISRKRTLLENLEEGPGNSVCRYPRVLRDLQTPNCLVYESTHGEALEVEAADSPESARKNLRLMIEGLLDQSLFLSLIDAEIHLENYVVLSGGHLGFSSVPSLAPIPVEWNYELLQYMACTVAGNSPRALHMLARISSVENSYAGEQDLMRKLSGLQPELKINLVTPESVTALENYWRALAGTRATAPLFLDLYHRQWTVMGQYNGDIAPSSDLIAETLWPVAGRILRQRFSELMSLEKAGEWMGSSGLLMLGAARQVGMTLEQVRDNDLAMIVDRQEHDSRDARLNRRAVAMVRSTIALAVLLLALHFALNSKEGVLKMTAALIAAAAAVALSLFVARIE